VAEKKKKGGLPCGASILGKKDNVNRKPESDEITVK